MAEEENPEFKPASGPVKTTLTAKFLIICLVGLAVAYFAPPIRIEESPPEPDPGIKPAVDYEVGPVIDNEYFEVVKDLFDSAREEIFIAQFIIEPPSLLKENWPEWRDDYVMELVEKLIAAHRRGVEVNVVLSGDYETTPEKNKINKQVCEYLRKQEVTCRKHTGDILLHDKVVMVDEKWVLQGSHNWTIGPMSTNREISLLLKTRGEEEWSWNHYRQTVEEGRM